MGRWKRRMRLAHYTGKLVYDPVPFASNEPDETFISEHQADPCDCPICRGFLDGDEEDDDGRTACEDCGCFMLIDEAPHCALCGSPFCPECLVLGDDALGDRCSRCADFSYMEP
jgi:hypothetical protein